MVTRLLPLLIVLTLGACLALGGCLALDPCEGRVDLLDSQEGLVLTEDEHPVGWGRDNCLQCHAIDSIHLADCTGEDLFDMDAVREAASDGTYESCVDCHGENGVEP